MTRLFEELQLRDLSFRNRIAVSPMWQYRGESGHATDWHLMHYGRFAEGGAGLVMQEGTSVDSRARGSLGDLGIWDDSFVPGLRRIVDLVHSLDALAGIQLMHPGAKARSLPPWEGKGIIPDESVDDMDPADWIRLSPSGVAPHTAAPGLPSHSMTRADVLDTQQLFVDATKRADAAGYDVVEIHAAHGYLLHTFLSPLTNLRTDEYGGSRLKRSRMLLETVERVRAVWPAGKPVFVRLSMIDEPSWTFNDTLQLSQDLKQLGVDLIDCSAGGISAPPNFGASKRQDRRGSYAYQAHFAARLREEVGIATEAVGLIVHPNHAAAIIDRGMADLAGIGREILYNPNWPIDAAQKLHTDPGWDRLPPHQAFWFRYREQGMAGFLPSTHGITAGGQFQKLSGATGRCQTKIPTGFEAPG